MLWLLAVLLLAGCAVPAAVREEDDAIKVQLLMDAMDEVGVCRPEQAVDVWARGLMERSAAMQYAVMTDSLREKYVKSLAKNAPNWVTGLSSPWVYGGGPGAAPTAGLYGVRQDRDVYRPGGSTARCCRSGGWLLAYRRHQRGR